MHPTDALLVTFAGSYVEAEFDSTVRTVTDVTDDAGNVTLPKGSVVDGIKDGNRIPSVPNWQLSAVATYTFPGAPAVKGKLRYRLLAIRRQIRSPSRVIRYSTPYRFQSGDLYIGS